MTFSYDATSRREVPTNPKIFRVRTDIGWDEMVHSYFKERQTLGGMMRGGEIAGGVVVFMYIFIFLDHFAKFKRR